MASTSEDKLAHLTEEQRARVDAAPDEKIRKKILRNIKRVRQRVNAKLQKQMEALHVGEVNNSQNNAKNSINTFVSPYVAPKREPKRKREDNSTSNSPTDNKKKTKHHHSRVAASSSGSVPSNSSAKVIDSVTYSEASTCVKMFLAFKEYPLKFMTYAEYKKVYMNLVVLITKHAPQLQNKPTFSSLKFHEGTIIVYCRDKFTAEWLESVSFDLKLGNQKFACYSEENFPEPPSFKFWIHGERLEFDVIQQLLQAQNVGLRTQFWHILHRFDTEAGQLIKAKIDFVSANTLKDLNYRAACGFQMVKFEMFGDKKETCADQTGDLMISEKSETQPIEIEDDEDDLK